MYRAFAIASVSIRISRGFVVVFVGLVDVWNLNSDEQNIVVVASGAGDCVSRATLFAGWKHLMVWKRKTTEIDTLTGCLACNSIRHGEVVRESIEKRRSNFSSVPALEQFATEIQAVLRRTNGGKEDGELLLLKWRSAGRDSIVNSLSSGKRRWIGAADHVWAFCKHNYFQFAKRWQQKVSTDESKRFITVWWSVNWVSI